MTQTFREKWLEAVREKNSVLCAGLDPAPFEMGRGERGLPQGILKREWALKYVQAVAPYCSAVKPNLQYWQTPGNRREFVKEEWRNSEFLKQDDMETLEEVATLAHSLGLVVIEDKKLADIGETNDAGMFYAETRSDAVTLALFAGNIAEAAKDLKSRGLGGIHMCIMSNPDYEREKNKLVQIPQENLSDYLPFDLIYVNDTPYVRQYQQLAHDSRMLGLDGIVLGAPSKKNHITEQELEKARGYAGDEMLVLLPGVGTQSGEASAIWKYFDKNNVIVNVGRDSMFPNGSNSTPEEQAERAKYYMEMLNELRASA